MITEDISHLAKINSAEMYIAVHTSFWISIFALLGYILRIGGLCDSSTLNFLRKLYAFFPLQMNQFTFPLMVDQKFFFSTSLPTMLSFW